MKSIRVVTSVKALGMIGNVRTRTARAWPAEEFMKLIAALP